MARPVRLVSGVPVAPAILVVMAGCGDRATPAGRLESGDSAGVTITVSTEPAGPLDSDWRIADAPAITIGSEGGAEPYQLDWVTDVLVLDGRLIVVANAGASKDLRFFDGEGRFLRRAGGAGLAPGEFGAFAELQMWPTEAGIVVGDAPAPRVHTFSPTAAPVRTTSFEPPPRGMAPRVVGIFADGSFLLASYESPAARPDQTYRSVMLLFRYSSEGKPLAQILQLETGARYVHPFPGGTHEPYLPFALDPVVRVAGSFLYVQAEGRPEVRQYDGQGQLRRIYRLAIRPLDANAAFPRLVEADLATIADPLRRQLFKNYYSLALPLPRHVPTHSGFFVDDLGAFWLERYRFPGEPRRHWDVVDSGGRWIASVRLRDRFWLYRAGSSYLAGVEVDTLGVERVRVLGLTRRAPEDSTPP